MLEGLGHTVTLFSLSEVTSTNLIAFDLLGMPRVLPETAGYSTAKPLLLAYHAAGKPILFGYEGLAVGGEGLHISLGLVSGNNTATGRGPNQYAMNARPIFAAAGVVVPNSIAVYAGTGFIEDIPPRRLSWAYS